MSVMVSGECRWDQAARWALVVSQSSVHGFVLFQAAGKGDSHGLLEVSAALSLLLRYCVEWLSDLQLNRFYRKQMAN